MPTIKYMKTIFIRIITVFLMIINTFYAHSQINSEDSIIPKYFFDGNSRLGEKSILLRGENDTIYSFISTVPIYRLILHEGTIIKLDIVQRLKTKNEYNNKGLLTSIIIEDTLDYYRHNLINIRFSFHPKNGKLKNCSSYFMGKLEGANFQYSSKGKMEYVFDYVYGFKWGYGWECQKHGMYKYEIYNKGVKIDSYGFYSRKHRLIGYMSRNGINYHQIYLEH